MCKKCDEIRKEVEDLRTRLCAMRDSYSRICDELWNIAHKRRRLTMDICPKYKVVFHMEVPIDEKDKDNWEKIYEVISNEFQKYLFEENGYKSDDVKKFYRVEEVKEG